MKKVKIGLVKANPNNPRVIKDDKFKKLVQSIRDLPEMADVRPLVVNQDMVVLGGNMRLKAMKEAGWTEVPIIQVNWDEDKQRQFIIKDNLSGGEWDWEMLANQWDSTELADWGLDVWTPPAEVDYGLLDNTGLENQIDELGAGVRKAIQIEFEPQDYDEAVELVKWWRQKGAYVGAMVVDHLKTMKDHRVE
jgi:hypothetical protein